MPTGESRSNLSINNCYSPTSTADESELDAFYEELKYVTYDEYKDDSYPQYCLGIAYVLHKTALLPMLDAVPEMKYFWIDDVFVTGFMARAANVSFVEINQFVERKPARKDFPDRIFYNDMMFYGTTKENIGRQLIDRTKYALQFN
ncbi:hypothetical protein RB195_017216 [Necator americanus]|uniref:Hexosyltransferase n=1 Tax=Necator americanus TaxID=51031 RepID=A0ABR1C576_NECAM